MIQPHGGRLVDRVVTRQRSSQLKDEVKTGPSIKLGPALFQNLINLSNGRYSPLDGFMIQNDFLEVVHNKTLEDGTICILPNIPDVDTEKATDLRTGEKVGLEIEFDDSNVGDSKIPLREFQQIALA